MTETVSSQGDMFPDNQNRLRELIENIDLGIAWLDTDFQVILVNSEMERLAGRPAAELIGRHCHEIFWDEAGHFDVCPGKLTMMTRSSVFREMENGLRNGSDLPVRIHAFPTFAGDGSLSGYVKVVENIDRRHGHYVHYATQKELENNFKALADVAPFKIWLSEPETGATFFNKCCLEFTGYPMEKALGRGWTECVHEEDRAQLLKMLKKTGKQRQLFRTEFRLRRSDGIYRWMLCLGAPRFQEDGCFVGYIGFCIDITEHKEMEKQLKAFNLVLEEKVTQRTASLQQVNAVLKDEIATREKIADELKEQQREILRQHEALSCLFTQVRHGKMEWELTLDCIKEVVVLVDSQGRIKRCNKALTDLMGLNYEELLGQELLPVFKDQELPIPDFFRQEVETVDLPCCIGGRWFLLNGYRLDADNCEAGAVITLYDYTNLRQLTWELENSHRELKVKSAQLEEAYSELQATQAKILQQEKMATIGQLAAGVAHEINNPIGFISSNLRTLEKYLGKLMDFIQLQEQALQEGREPRQTVAEARRKLKIDYIAGDVTDLVAESLEGAERVRKIVQDLKTFSRENKAERKFVDLVECLESTINIVWNEIKYKASLVRGFAELPPVRCNPHQIGQVLMNLLLNAAQAIDKDGQITVKTWQEDDTVSFSVADTGCGIPEENLGRLFEPFFTTKPVGKGTGLGLSVSYEIVQKHQGEINVESTPGQGTTFSVRLPVDAGEAMEAAAE